MVKIYLDDLRPTPEGYIRTFEVQETIDLIVAMDGEIDTVSLDNDLGENLPEGYMVANWIEQSAYFGTLKPIKNLLVHSANNVRHKDMLTAFANAKKYWEQK